VTTDNRQLTTSPVNVFLDTASGIARRVCRDAIWAGDSCNWMGPSVESMGAWDVRHKSFGPELYAGTAGVALFLASVARAAGGAIIRKTAEGAARHAHAHVGEIPPSLSMGVYSGKLGVAWALHTIAERLGDGEWQKRAIALLDSIEANAHGLELDLMGGCAGAIPVLIELFRRYARSDWMELALRLGVTLEQAAVRSSEGWSWKTLEIPGQPEMRHLTGFSHGAAGIGWAFLELFKATGEKRFREAAEGAFQYERTHYSAENENWPDFRDYLRPPGSPPAPAFGMAWCHGAPGIALSRLRAWRLTGDLRAGQEAEVAVRITQRALESGDPARTGFSLCHGCAGNADIMLEAHRELGAAGLRPLAEKIAYRGIELFESQRLPWPCGVPGAAETANLMLGTSGIGYFYLRLADPNFPTVLMIGPEAGRQGD
jgi:lantibiotic modifying enzyme